MTSMALCTAVCRHGDNVCWPRITMLEIIRYKQFQRTDNSLLIDNQALMAIEELYVLAEMSRYIPRHLGT